MNHKLQRYFLMLGFAIAILFLCITSCNKKPSAGEIVGISDNHVQSTALGIKVHSKTGVSMDELSQIDRGFMEAKTDALNSHYLRKLDPNEYKINVANSCVPSPEQHIPSFKVNVTGTIYDGSVYDTVNTKGLLPTDKQNEFSKYVPDGTAIIYAAELVMNYGLGYPYQNQYGEMEVCRELLENGTRYGTEHIMILHNDAPYYDVTQIHDVYSHPLLPQKTERHPTLIVNGSTVPDPQQLDPSATPYPTPKVIVQ